MEDKIKAMIKANFAADSLALGVHWIYDTDQIKNSHGEVTQLLPPAPGSYHPTKNRGDFTHYGDQTLVLLESVAASGGFNLNDFFMRWQHLFESYDGYHDMATKTTLKNIQKGKGPETCGSLSEDMSPASRIAPLFLFHAHDPETLLEAARAQTEMTHRGSTAVDAAQFFTRLALACINGEAPASAAVKIADEHFEYSPIHMWVQQGIAAKDQNPVDAISRFGQACSTSEAFPGIIQLISKYEDTLSGALVQAIMAGGENAARARIVAMILAAYQGLDNETQQWFQRLQKKEAIDELLDTAQ
ncbi:MAG: ADP-ribosylglycohydrolase family protein [Desulfobacterium sp.]